MNVMTDWFKDKLLDHALRNIVWTPPSVVYLALFTTATTNASGGTEVTGGGYVRKAVSFAAAVTPGFRESSAAVEFYNMPAVTVLDAALMTALTAGNMMIHGPLATSETLADGRALRFLAGEIEVTFS